MELEAVKKIDVNTGDVIYVRYKFGNLGPAKRADELAKMKEKLREIFPNNQILISGEEVDITILAKEPGQNNAE